MSGPEPPAPVPPDVATLPLAMLDRLMPMHMVLCPTGHICHAGPTLARLFAGRPLVGRRFLEVFEMRRPRDVESVAELRDPAGVALSVRLREAQRTGLKGLAVPLDGQGGLLVNLSLGINAVEAVGQYHLTAADFAPTDLTIEMLYLVEAKKAVLTESRNLNTRLQGAMIAAEEQAFTDTLTGLKNRRAMDHILARLVEAGAAFGMMHLDLDFFKEVNDTHGHAAGDHVLQQAARVLIDATRAGDAVVRAGGDEFVLIFPRLTCHDRLARIARRIIAGLQRPIPFEGVRCRISASIGIVTTAAYDAPEVERMLQDCDRALYASKRAGRSRITFAAPGQAPAETLHLPADDPARQPKATRPGRARSPRRKAPRPAAKSAPKAQAADRARATPAPDDPGEPADVPPVTAGPPAVSATHAGSGPGGGHNG